jgi:hypothetical protein
MPGRIQEWFYHDRAGIGCDPAGPGFKKIIIHPQPVGDLTRVKAAYDSIRGMIEQLEARRRSIHVERDDSRQHNGNDFPPGQVSGRRDRKRRDCRAEQGSKIPRDEKRPRGFHR